MTKRALFPIGSKESAEAIKISPGIVSGNHIFLTGMTGSKPDGSMPSKPEEQFRSAFEKILLVLNEEDLTFCSVVEMTTYHIGLREHFDLFNQVRSNYVQAPHPAWTAVEVAGLRREGALVEVRVIAAMDGVG